jgi:hypothetical protein
VLLGRIVKLDGAEHDAVVGQGDPRRPLIGGLAAKRINAARTIEQRVLAVYVQMNEGTQRKANLGRQAGAGDSPVI